MAFKDIQKWIVFELQTIHFVCQKSSNIEWVESRWREREQTEKTHASSSTPMPIIITLPDRYILQYPKHFGFVEVELLNE